MGGEWQKVPLDNLVQPDRRISYGIVQPGSHDPRGVPIVRVADIRGGRIQTRQPLRVSESIESNYARTRLQGGELLLTLVGTVGETAIAPPELAGWNLARAVAVIPVRQDVGARWVRYALGTPAIRQLISSKLNTTVQATLNLADVAQLPIVLPAPAVREAIAGLLDALDDKIELNRRMAETVEAMARALFKNWFIDFDPVRAKADGRPTGLPDYLTVLFPDGFSEDGLPRGWTIKTVGSLYDIIGGNTPSTERQEYWGKPHQWATPKDLSTLSAPVLLCTGRQLTDAGLMQVSSGLLPARSLLLSSRAPIGYMAFTTRPTAINQGFAGITQKEATTAYAWAWCHANMETISGNAGGSTFPEISKSAFRALPMLAPSQPALDAFASVADRMIERIIAAVQQQQVLTQLRNTLLPKLISGELRIADAEQRIAAA